MLVYPPDGRYQAYFWIAKNRISLVQSDILVAGEIYRILDSMPKEKRQQVRQELTDLSRDEKLPGWIASFFGLKEFDRNPNPYGCFTRLVSEKIVQGHGEGYTEMVRENPKTGETCTFTYKSRR